MQLQLPLKDEIAQLVTKAIICDTKDYVELRNCLNGAFVVNNTTYSTLEVFELFHDCADLYQVSTNVEEFKRLLRNAFSGITLKCICDVIAFVLKDNLAAEVKFEWLFNKIASSKQFMAPLEDFQFHEKQKYQHVAGRTIQPYEKRKIEPVIYIPTESDKSSREAQQTANEILARNKENAKKAIDSKLKDLAHEDDEFISGMIEGFWLIAVFSDSDAKSYRQKLTDALAKLEPDRKRRI